MSFINRIDFGVNLVKAGLHLASGSPNDWTGLKVQKIDRQDDHVRIEMHLASPDGNSGGLSVIQIQRGMTPRLDFQSTTSILFDKHHKGSGNLGILAITSPVLLVASPILLGMNLYYSHKETQWGHSRHSEAVLQALKGQLDEETENELRLAMAEAWKTELYLTQSVTFEKAQELLKTCEKSSMELYKKDSDMKNSDDALAISSAWFDADGKKIATYDLREEGTPYLTVFGTTFKGEQAKALVQNFKTQKITRRHDRK
jgi:hypothetical protein